MKSIAHIVAVSALVAAVGAPANAALIGPAAEVALDAQNTELSAAPQLVHSHNYGSGVCHSHGTNNGHPTITLHLCIFPLSAQQGRDTQRQIQRNPNHLQFQRRRARQ